jgi:hypothetical protein
LFVDVVIDFAEFRHNAFVGPSLKRAADIDTDNFAKDTSIDTLYIIVWEHHCTFLGVNWDGLMNALIVIPSNLPDNN